MATNEVQNLSGPSPFGVDWFDTSSSPADLSQVPALLATLEPDEAARYTREHLQGLPVDARGELFPAIAQQVKDPRLLDAVSKGLQDATERGDLINAIQRSPERGDVMLRVANSLRGPATNAAALEPAVTGGAVKEGTPTKRGSASRFGFSAFNLLAVAGAALKFKDVAVVAQAVPKVAPVIPISVAAAKAAAAETAMAATATQATVAVTVTAATEVAVPVAGGAAASGGTLWGGLALGGGVAVALGLAAAGAVVVSRSRVGGQSGPITEPGPSERRHGAVGPDGGTQAPGGVPQPLEDAGISSSHGIQTKEAHEESYAPERQLLVGFPDINGKMPPLRGILLQPDQDPNWIAFRTNASPADEGRTVASGDKGSDEGGSPGEAGLPALNAGPASKQQADQNASAQPNQSSSVTAVLRVGEPNRLAIAAAEYKATDEYRKLGQAGNRTTGNRTAVIRGFMAWAVENDRLRPGDTVSLPEVSRHFGGVYQMVSFALNGLADGRWLVRREGAGTRSGFQIAVGAKEILANWQPTPKPTITVKTATPQSAALEAYKTTEACQRLMNEGSKTDVIRQFMIWAIESGRLKPGDSVTYRQTAKALGAADNHFLAVVALKNFVEQGVLSIRLEGTRIISVAIAQDAAEAVARNRDKLLLSDSAWQRGLTRAALDAYKGTADYRLSSPDIRPSEHIRNFVAWAFHGGHLAAGDSIIYGQIGHAFGVPATGARNALASFVEHGALVKPPDAHRGTPMIAAEGASEIIARVHASSAGRAPTPTGEPRASVKRPEPQ